VKERTQSKDRKRDNLRKAMNLLRRSTKDVKVEPLEKGRLIFRSYEIIGCPSMGVEIEKLVFFLEVKFSLLLIKILPLASVLCLPKPVHTLTPYLVKFHLISVSSYV
jgi:hypothetical protein